MYKGQMYDYKRLIERATEVKDELVSGNMPTEEQIELLRVSLMHMEDIIAVGLWSIKDVNYFLEMRDENEELTDEELEELAYQFEEQLNGEPMNEAMTDIIWWILRDRRL